ncbi:MerR family transcriptional regulator [Tindallia californiensis]|uniref:DNA-binding transcriptional regulator, MerR family n=1 Tax=Tindallia californiensis TaxID=159292 RepID=A0A1H3P4H2_9FIRM|nr:MerR family transcriptional regulator [Tindallia californiensis]SDY95968.1 DNA-binding transcriptional regulator, MerR family [Tindallia californiensis]
MSFSIGQVSRIFGFTRQAVRFYEEKGLISPTKDKNGWRYYDEDDIARLISARKYLAMGYKITEVVEQFTNSTPESIAKTLDEKHRMMSKEIERLKVLADTVDDYRGKIRQLNQSIGVFSIRYSPPLSLFYSQPDNQLQDERIPDTMAWVDALPVSKITAFYRVKKDNQYFIMERQHKGFSIEQTYADQYGLRHLETTQFLSGQLCANVVLTVQSKDIASLHVEKDALSFFEEIGLEIRGNPWGQIIFSDCRQSKPGAKRVYRQYIDLWIPVKKSK